MKKLFRIGVVLAAVMFGLVAQKASAQVSVQRMTFSLVSEYETNILSTNSTTLATNDHTKIHDILIGTFNVVKAIAIDLDGTNSKTWNGSELVREVNLTNGNEGIFLRKAGNQTNVSSFFSGTFSNNFTSAVSNLFPGSTNFPGVTNVDTDQFQLTRGWVYGVGSTNATTNHVVTGGIYALSLNTTNIKLNLIGVGDGKVTEVGGNVAGTIYKAPIASETLGSVGTFYLNSTTNIFNLGTNGPQYITGPFRGTFIVGPPHFLNIVGP